MCKKCKVNLIKHVGRMTLKSLMNLSLMLICSQMLVPSVFAGKPDSDIPYTITTVPADSEVSKSDLVLDAGQVAWRATNPTTCDTLPFGFGEICYSDIYLYDGTVTTQLTDNFYDDTGHGMHSGQVAWVADRQPSLCPAGSAKKVSFYNGNSISEISHDAYLIPNLNTHNGQVVWTQEPDECASNYYSDKTEVYFFDGVTTSRLTDDSYYNGEPLINNGRIAWTVFDGNDNEVVIWENGTLTQVTNNDYDDTPMMFDGEYMLISGSGGLSLWDGTSVSYITGDTTLGDMSNGQVVWAAVDPADLDVEIFLYDGSITRQLTTNSVHDHSPRIHNGQVAWDSEGDVYVWDGSDTYRLFDGVATAAPYNVDINNGQVVWGYSNASLGMDIFLATPAGTARPAGARR